MLKAGLGAVHHMSLSSLALPRSLMSDPLSIVRGIGVTHRHYTVSLTFKDAENVLQWAALRSRRVAVL